MKRYFKFVLLLGICLIFLTGCIVDLVIPENDINSPATEGSSADENPVEGLGTGKGTLKIYLTDAPGDYLEVNVMISKIDGHIAGNEEEGEDEGSWELLKKWDGGLQVDLTELVDVSILLASLELDPNKYTQLRLFLMGGEEDAWIVLNDSSLTKKALEIPSVYQTGIKLNRPFEIVAGMIIKLTIDFDAEKSVVKTGNGKYKLKPVIHVTSETYSEEEEPPEGIGTVSGTVFYDGGDLGLIGIGGASVSLSGGAYIFENTTTTSGEEGSEGDFSLINVPTGTYTLNVVADGYDNYSESILVEAGLDTEVVIVLSPRGISGIVVNSETTNAIEGANVSVILDTVTTATVTDTDGKFSIEQLPVGIYDIKVTAGGYVEYNASGISVVAAGGIIDVGIIELELLPPPLP